MSDFFVQRRDACAMIPCDARIGGKPRLRVLVFLLDLIAIGIRLAYKLLAGIVDPILTGVSM
jgi:hypothetical protein